MTLDEWNERVTKYSPEELHEELSVLDNALSWANHTNYMTREQVLDAIKLVTYLQVIHKMAFYATPIDEVSHD